MAHESGNPTWQDYPNQSTLVTAAGLEAIENVIDGLLNRPVCEARLTSNYVNLGPDWYVMRGQMAALSGSDPFGMFQQPSGAGTNYQIVIPSGWDGRYEVLWQTIYTNIAAGVVPAAAVLLNVSDAANGAATVGAATAIRGHAPNAGATAPVSCYGSVKLAGGDRLALAVSAGVTTWTLSALQNGYTRTKVVVRYAGRY